MWESDDLVMVRSCGEDGQGLQAFVDRGQDMLRKAHALPDRPSSNAHIHSIPLPQESICRQ